MPAGVAPRYKQWRSGMATGESASARGYSVRRLRAVELADCGPLAAEGFGFGTRDQVPPWLMHTTNCYGGLSIGAFAGSGLVGFSFAMPAFVDRPFLLSCGLTVGTEHRGRGVGEALKRAQAEEARRAGYARIRWTTGSLASRPLRLYLSKLGARLVRLREDMYSEVRPVELSDEVEIDWELDGPCTAPQRRLGAGERVEIPWAHAPLVRRPEEAVHWMLRVRSQMKQLLAEGHVGTSVVLDREARRSFVVFEPASGAG